MPEHPIRTTLAYGLAAGLVFAACYDLLEVRFFHATLLGLGFWFCLACYALLLARMYRKPMGHLILPLLSGSVVICLLYLAHVRTFHLLLVNLLLFVWLRSQLFPSDGGKTLLLESVLGGSCMLISVVVLRLGLGMDALGVGLAVWLFFQIQSLFFLWHPCPPPTTNRFERAYLTAQRLLGQGS